MPAVLRSSPAPRNQIRVSGDTKIDPSDDMKPRAAIRQRSQASGERHRHSFFPRSTSHPCAHDRFLLRLVREKRFAVVGIVPRLVPRAAHVELVAPSTWPKCANTLAVAFRRLPNCAGTPQRYPELSYFKSGVAQPVELGLWLLNSAARKSFDVVARRRQAAPFVLSTNLRLRESADHP